MGALIVVAVCIRVVCGQGMSGGKLRPHNVVFKVLKPDIGARIRVCPTRTAAIGFRTICYVIPA